MMVGLVLIFLAVSAGRGLQISQVAADEPASRLPVPFQKQITLTEAHRETIDDGQSYNSRPIAAHDGLAFVGTISGEVYVVDVKRGGEHSNTLSFDATPGQQKVQKPISSIAFDGEVLVVGAQMADNYMGRVSLFTREGSPKRNLVVPGDWCFGAAVAVDNGVIVVLSLTGAYVLETSGHLRTKLEPESRWNLWRASVAVENDVIAVGTPEDRDDGSVHIFNTAGYQVGRLTAPEARHCFGQSVAIDNGLIAVGAPHYCRYSDSGCSRDEVGKAYVFDTHVQTMTELKTTDGADHFGSQVTFEAGLVLVVATPAVYVFDAATGDLRDSLLSPQTTHCSQIALDYANRRIIEFGTFPLGELLERSFVRFCDPELAVYDFSDVWITQPLGASR